MSDAPLALVTGGCRRIGAAIAMRLAREGFALALHGHRDADPEPALAEVLTQTGIDWNGFVADFADAQTATGLYGEVVAQFGRAPDLLVNSASMFGSDRLEDASAADLAVHYAVNCSAPALLIQAFAASQGAGDRSVVNLLDQRLDQPHGDQLAYTLSKFGLAGLTRIAARSLAPAIRVNAVAPGLTLPTDDYEAPQMKRLAAAMPLERLPAAGEIADAVLYLAQARSVTGQVLCVDGGARFVAFERDFMHLER